MSRLYDRLRSDIVKDIESSADWLTVKAAADPSVVAAWTAEPIVFDITNVAEYARQHYRDRRIESDDEFPNVAPPFAVYWMEWHDRNDQWPETIVDRLGVLITGADFSKHQDDPETTGYRWGLAVKLMCEIGHRRAGCLATWAVKVTNDGRATWDLPGGMTDEAVDYLMPVGGSPSKDDILDDPELDALFAEIETLPDDQKRRAIQARLDEAHERIAVLEAEFRAEAGAILGRLLEAKTMIPVLLAHSLMACKNVEVDDHDPPERLSRRQARKHGVPLVRFKTLRIVPTGGRRRQSEGDRVDIGGGLTALHVVRGHFKTYTPDRPLFGSRVGTYWWSPQARGDEAAGVIVKDYEMGDVR